ncbi:hypothetical protein G3N30_02210 [Microbacterium lacticum]|uniref:hypothetical protein n=1 Tax=Microbacterium lacticum TaxID=33885 RepID=UPI0018B0D990|nr:hypothetical protein [Microbacterium lacticum]MBF9335085.1 hypothetical protein [Microbacterium lacticum]
MRDRATQEHARPTPQVRVSSMRKSGKDEPTALFAKVPGKEYGRLIFRYPYHNDSMLAMSYHEAATRLAGTFEGQPIDDTMLLPFLTLYRQAIELRLKETIRDLAALRRRFHDPSNPKLQPAAVEKRLRSPRILGHNLEALLNELLDHYNALELDEQFPESARDLVMLLHEADTSGTAFRYSGQMPDIQEHLDFPDLVALLDGEFRLLGGIEDWITEMHAAGPQPEDDGDWY